MSFQSYEFSRPSPAEADRTYRVVSVFHEIYVRIIGAECLGCQGGVFTWMDRMGIFSFLL